jgi:hypothetical protein
MNGGRWVLIGLAVVVGAVLALELPNIRRYIRIERM